MNSVTGMSHVRFGLSHGVIVAGDSGDDGNSCAVKAQMWKTNSAEKLMPFFRGVFGKIHKLMSVLFLRPPNERDKVSMKRGGVDAITFCRKADGAALQIDVPQRNSGFGDSTALSHCHEPRVVHPRLLFAKRFLNCALFGECNFGFLFRGDSLVAELEQDWQ